MAYKEKPRYEVEVERTVRQKIWVEVEAPGGDAQEKGLEESIRMPDNEWRITEIVEDKVISVKRIN